MNFNRKYVSNHMINVNNSTLSWLNDGLSYVKIYYPDGFVLRIFYDVSNFMVDGADLIKIGHTYTSINYDWNMETKGYFIHNENQFKKKITLEDISYTNIKKVLSKSIEIQ